MYPKGANQMNELVIAIKSVPGGYRAHFAGRRGPMEVYRSQMEALGALVWRHSHMLEPGFDDLVMEIHTEKEIERHDRNGCSVRPKGKKWSGQHPTYP